MNQQRKYLQSSTALMTVSSGGPVKPSALMIVSSGGDVKPSALMIVSSGGDVKPSALLIVSSGGDVKPSALSPTPLYIEQVVDVKEPTHYSGGKNRGPVTVVAFWSAVLDVNKHCVSCVVKFRNKLTLPNVAVLSAALDVNNHDMCRNFCRVSYASLVNSQWIHQWEWLYRRFKVFVWL